MKFTYGEYENLIDMLRVFGYSFAGYDNYNEFQQPVIMRHDIDTSLEKALSMAKIEHDKGVKSTYFVLLATDLYNIASNRSLDIIREIQKMGHEIGLHFDETKYRYDQDSVPNLIKYEANIMAQIIGTPIKAVSMHRPSENTLKADYIINGMINSYGMTFFQEFKYVSDSRMRWREDVTSVIQSGIYNKLHILTHAFWYDEEEKDIRSVITQFINQAGIERYQSLKDNITNLDDLLK